MGTFGFPSLTRQLPRPFMIDSSFWRNLSTIGAQRPPSAVVTYQFRIENCKCKSIN